MIGRVFRNGRVLPLLLLALLFAGTAAHLGHHWLDPECGAESGPSSHPCVACSALHGAVEPDAGVASLAAPPRPDSWVPQSTTTARDAAGLSTTSPRAPPLA